MKLCFAKYEGSGNDFILLDGRKSFPSLEIQTLCHRQFGIGSDGLIVLELSSVADCKMRIFNSDGSEASMCGNGLRCFCLYVKELGLVGDVFTVETNQGIYPCTISQGRVEVVFPIPAILYNKQIPPLEDVVVVRAGVEHAVVFVEEIEKYPVLEMGRFIRFHPALAPLGANANFIELQDNIIKIRTYERGVEKETLSCGTGAVAAAFVVAKNKGIDKPLRILPMSGQELQCQVTKDNAILNGPAKKVFTGQYFL